MAGSWSLFTAALISLVSCVRGRKPNVILMVGDDMGWANAGWHNPDHVLTPFMNRMISEEGVELDRQYAFFYCSPTRTSLMTGRYPIHVTENNDFACTTDGPAPMEMKFLPKLLSTVGYSSHQIGKWHMGGLGTGQSTPMGKGFNSSFGYLWGMEDHMSNVNPACGKCNGLEKVDLWRTDRPAHGENGTLYTAELFTNEAVSIIKAAGSEPFFMYLAMCEAHAPTQPGKYGSLYPNYTTPYMEYNGMISAIDDSFKNLTEALHETNLWNDTLIIFTSDNGGPSSVKVAAGSANNYPLRGGKWTAWEGGHRVQAFITGGVVPDEMKGQKLEGLIHVSDWFTTICTLAGVDLPATESYETSLGLPPIDGLNIWSYVTGQSAQSPRTEIPLSSSHSAVYRGSHSPFGPSAYISGKYKLVRFDQPYAIWMGPVYPNASTTHKNETTYTACGAKGCLFNIFEDPGEHLDLCDSEPDTCSQLRTRAEYWDNQSIEIGRSPGWRGVLNHTRYCQQADLNGGFWGPYEP